MKSIEINWKSIEINWKSIGSKLTVNWKSIDPILFRSLKKIHPKVDPKIVWGGGDIIWHVSWLHLNGCQYWSFEDSFQHNEWNVDFLRILKLNPGGSPTEIKIQYCIHSLSHQFIIKYQVANHWLSSSIVVNEEVLYMVIKLCSYCRLPIINGYNWVFLWDYTFHFYGVTTVSTYTWYFYWAIRCHRSRRLG